MNENLCFFIGRLADKVVYHPAKGEVSSHAVGRLIVNRIPGKDGKSRYDSIPFSAWGAHADTLHNYTDKGKQLSIRGELRHNPVQRADGSYDNYYEILVAKVGLGNDSSAAKLHKASAKSGITISDLGAEDVQKLMDSPVVQEALKKINQGAQPEKVLAPKPTAKVDAGLPGAENPFAD